MKTAIALCVAASAVFFSPAHAESYMAKSGKDKIVITPANCPASVSRHIKPEHVPQFRFAHVTLNGKLFAACWTLADPQTIFVMYEDGDTGEVPVAAFELVKAV